MLFWRMAIDGIQSESECPMLQDISPDVMRPYTRAEMLPGDEEHWSVKL